MFTEKPISSTPRYHLQGITNFHRFLFHIKKPDIVLNVKLNHHENKNHHHHSYHHPAHGNPDAECGRSLFQIFMGNIPDVEITRVAFRGSYFVYTRGTCRASKEGEKTWRRCYRQQLRQRNIQYTKRGRQRLHQLNYE